MAASLRRACARVLLVAALVCATVGFVAIQTRALVADPEAVAGAAGRALDGPAAREAVVPWVAEAIERQVPGVPLPAEAMAREAVTSPWFPATFEQAVAEAHAYVFSDRSTPPTVDAGPLAADIRAAVARVDAELAALLIPDARLTLAVPAAGLPDLRRPAGLLGTVGPAALLAAGALAVAATALNPDPGRPLRQLGIWITSLGGLAMVTVTLALPALAGSTSGAAGVGLRAAAELRVELLVPAALAVAAGTALVLLAGRLPARRAAQPHAPAPVPVTAGLALR